jgi:methylated-DNA-[protein]-cysteine S-methyltransferase
MNTIVDDIREAYSRPSDAAIQDTLRARLAASAESAGVLDIAVRTVDSPFGPLLLAATEEGVVRLAFELEDHDSVHARLATAISPRILRAPRRLDAAADQLDQYFAGRRRGFDLPVDLRLAHGFRRTVLDHLRAIPYGVTESYAQVAAGAGNPTAVRAAASACSHNPVPLIVPCHRVIRSDGAIGNYLAGAAVKEALLGLEAAA